MRQFLVLCAATLAACWTPSTLVNRAMNKTVDSAASRVGDEVGKAIAADILAKNPHLIQGYAMGVFNVMFYQGGYYFETGSYKPGQYTTWETSGLEQGDWFEKTLLAEHSNGNQWWRVETHSNTNEKEPSVVVMEALFSAPTEAGSRQVRRMRALLPGETEPREIPITEQNAQTWHMSNNQRLTQESMDGMTVGEETVETPAGSFTAKHLQTKGYDSTSMNWWLSDQVPGQLVKFVRTKPESDEVYYQVLLKEYGEGRTESKLGVDLNEKVAPTQEGGAPEETPET